MNYLSVLLNADMGASPYSSIIMMVAIIAIFYFFMIRPQSKKQKEIQKFREALKVGDRVITSGGIYGKVKEIKDNVILLEIAESVRVKVDKSSCFASAEETSQQS